MFHKEIDGLDFFLLNEYTKSNFAKLVSDYYEKTVGFVDFVYDKWGKPFLRHNCQLYPASVTNSKNIGIVAVDFKKKYFSIGIDLELKNVFDSVVKRICTISEQDIIKKGKVSYADVWMAKEAVVKAIGSGIGIGLSNIAPFSNTSKNGTDIFKISFLAKREINGYFFYLTAIDINCHNTRSDM